MKVRSYMNPVGLVREHVTEHPEQTGLKQTLEFMG